jgi:hypothetical protein
MSLQMSIKLLLTPNLVRYDSSSFASLKLLMVVVSCLGSVPPADWASEAAWNVENAPVGMSGSANFPSSSTRPPLPPAVSTRLLILPSRSFALFRSCCMSTAGMPVARSELGVRAMILCDV